jgi:sugar lactone lactonase YvrE
MCDPSGRFWAGTISTTKQTGDASLYMFDREGQLHKKIPRVTNSNGICWSADASLMYYIDTLTKKVMAYPFENETGNLGVPKVVIDTQSADVEGSPDGMAIDIDGNLWIAMCHGGAVIQVETQTGKVVKKISFPCVETTACTFGGAHYDRLFVTTGLHKTLSEPDAGKVFVVDGLSTHGFPVVPYKGSI